MRKLDLITPEGTKDYLFEECRIKHSIENRLHSIFQLSGYSEILTPGIEYYDIFDRDSMYFPEESLYKLVDHKGKLLVLRPDSTMPIARVVSSRLREAKLPLRLYYNQNIFSANRSLTGKSDEIAQTGIELIGSESSMADLEVLTTAIEILSACDEEQFRLEIGHSGFFRELIGRLNVSEEISEEIRILIESKNYPGLNDILDRIGDTPVTRGLKQLPRLFGGEEVFEKASKLFKDKEIDVILNDLKAVYQKLSVLGNNGKIIVDLGIVNRTDYYTGIVMKGYLQGCGDEILSGGRYDRLLSEFGYPVPATGFAVNITAITSLMLKKHESEPEHADVALYCNKQGMEMETFLKAKEIRANGKKAEIVFASSEEEAYQICKAKEISEFIVIGGDSDGE